MSERVVFLGVAVFMCLVGFAAGYNQALLNLAHANSDCDVLAPSLERPRLQRAFAATRDGVLCLPTGAVFTERP